MKAEGLIEFAEAFEGIGFRVVARHVYEASFGEQMYELERPPAVVRLGLDRYHSVDVDLRLAPDEWWGPPFVYRMLNGLAVNPVAESTEDYVGLVSAILDQTGGVFSPEFVREVKQVAWENGQALVAEIRSGARDPSVSTQNIGDWDVVFQESSDDEVHGSPHDRFMTWRTAHDPDALVPDDDIRVDIWPTTGGDRLRILIRRPPPTPSPVV